MESSLGNNWEIKQESEEGSRNYAQCSDTYIKVEGGNTGAKSVEVGTREIMTVMYKRQSKANLPFKKLGRNFIKQKAKNSKKRRLKSNYEENISDTVKPVQQEIEYIAVPENLKPDHSEDESLNENILQDSIKSSSRFSKKPKINSKVTSKTYALNESYSEEELIVENLFDDEIKCKVKRKIEIANNSTEGKTINLKLGDSESEESDGLEEFLNAVEPKKPKYKPRKKPQLTEEQKAEKERRKLEKRTCTICNTVFAFPGGLRNHMRSKHTLEKPYSCEFCGEQFSIQSSYSLHRRRHLGIKPHLCNLCGKTFLRRMDMRIHIRIHTPSENKIRDVKCNFCANVYTSKINLRKHVLIKHTDPSEWKHECNICGKKCSSATDLTHHIRQHNDDRKFKCVICGRGFFTKQSMNVHVRTHSANTVFNCEHCSNGYRSNEALQRHKLKVHFIGKTKPISNPKHFCPVCKESFRQRARFEQHLALHETGKEEYPFKCNQCDKRYKARNYFTIHMMDKHKIFIDDSYFKTHFQSGSQENCRGLGEIVDGQDECSYNKHIKSDKICDVGDLANICNVESTV